MNGCSSQEHVKGPFRASRGRRRRRKRRRRRRRKVYSKLTQ